MSKRTARTPKASYTVVTADSFGGEVRYDFELGGLVAVQNGRAVGYPKSETDGERMLAEVRMAASRVA